MIEWVLLLFPLFCVIMAFREGSEDNFLRMFGWMLLLFLWMLALPFIGEPPNNDCINYIDDFGVYHCIDKEIFFNHK